MGMRMGVGMEVETEVEVWGEEGGGLEGKETLRTHSSAIASSKPNPTKPMGLHFQSWDI